MSEVAALIAQRDELLVKLRDIEENCEGIENEHNAQRVQELNMEETQLIEQKENLQEKLGEIQRKLSRINDEIRQLSGTGIDRILEAIKGQRWYFFKNKPKVLMDKTTGLLWANITVFPYRKSGECRYDSSELETILSQFDFDGIDGFRVPAPQELWHMIYDKTFPFQEGDHWRIKCIDYWYVMKNHQYYSKDLYDEGAESDISGNRSSALLPCSDIYSANSDYAGNISPDNPVYSEKERLQFTLNLFVENGLWPVFTDEGITQLYKKIYFEKPALLQRLQEIQTQIEALQTTTLLSSTFDYTALLAGYDIKAIDGSIIKYYQAIQQWTLELMGRLDDYEEKMEKVIRDFNLVSLKLSKKYEDNPHLTDAENELLLNRQRYFQKKFSLGMNGAKDKILAVKKQADDLEYYIDEIDGREDSIYRLALLEKKTRASFSFIAENTAKIIKNALLRIEYFQEHHQFVLHAVDLWEKWSEGYRVFKTTYREDLKTACEEDGIEREVWQTWYTDWQKIRFAIEQKLQPVIERGLKAPMPMVTENEVSVPEQLIAALGIYKKSIDSFFLEERKGIYQKFVFQAGGELQDKFEVESALYKCTFALQSALSEIVFNCRDAEDRIFILKWANSMLDIQIDEILTFVADNDLQKISKEILAEFAALKQKNYAVYLTDAKAYSEEKMRREKEYNSLIFKMRKDLMKQ